MRVFVTGATGFIGSATVQELLKAGHEVIGLARSDDKAAALAATGAEVLRGSIEDLDSLRAGTEAADGVIHLAFIHDFSDFAENCRRDRVAIEAMGEVLEGTSKPILVTSGVAMLANGRVATEEDRSPEVSASYPRASEAASNDLAARGIRSSVVRLSPSVHGAGDHGFVPMLINIAREKGVSAYVGDGANRWPGVHRFDAAALYRLALEKGAVGARYHGTAEDGVLTREIAEAIGQGLGLPVVSKSPEEAGAHFGFLGYFFGLDCPASSEWTRENLGWVPTGPGLLEDVAANYFG